MFKHLSHILFTSLFTVLAVTATGADFTALAPGKVRPTGWLRDWCLTTKGGYIGHLDDIDRHFQIAWTTNCMRRGANLSWPNAHEGSWSAEGGAYWFDGLVRLAWELDDPELKAYAKKRLDTLLDRMNPHAITFVHWMDRRDPAQMKEMQDANEAWIGWASGILGRAIAAYYEASGDPRALRALNWAFNDVRFFEYGNGKPVPSAAWETYRLGKDPAVGAALDAWCAKGPENHIVWRYARPVEPNQIDFKPGKKKDWRAQHGVLACETAIAAVRASYWRNGKAEWRENVLKWSDFLRANALQPYGVPVADESWGFTGPDRGTETCTVAADIRLNGELLELLADGRYGDRVERALFNAGAACTTSGFDKHVYVQTPNRTVVENRGEFMCPVSARFYLHKNWPLCCTAALTRYVPDFVQHLWMTTSDGGLAATLYAPNTVEVDVKGTVVRVETVTDYPFGETIKMVVEPAKALRFPLKLRVPEWCANLTVSVNGQSVAVKSCKGFTTLDRDWSAGDTVTVNLPMKPMVTTGRDRNKGEPGVPWCAVSAGPLLFARNLEGVDENKLVPGEKMSWHVNPAAVEKGAALTRRPMPGVWSWSPMAMPVSVTVPTTEGPLELIPYGSTCLRVSMFDVVE